MQQAIEIIKVYKHLPHNQWDDKLEEIREKLRGIGFYELPVDEREMMVKEAKQIGDGR